MLFKKKNGAKFLSEQYKMNNKKEIYVCMYNYFTNQGSNSYDNDVLEYI